MLQAFKLMRKKRIGGIPVVECGGKKAIGNISLRDIQFLLTAPEIYSDYRFVMNYANHFENFYFTLDMFRLRCSKLSSFDA